ncbi:kelch repeat-containing protein [Flavobacteriaceae bacterium GF1]
MIDKLYDRKTSILTKAFAIGILFIGMVSCSNDDDDDENIGNWVDRSIFDGTPRSGAFAFTLGNFGYMGTGFDGDDRLSDVWVFDMEGNFWAQLADFPGTPRSSAIAFALNGNGYVGLGYDGDDELGDFYSYNIANNTWASIGDFAGTPRRGAIAFNSTTNGYVGTGFDGDNDKKDFWRFNPADNSWEELVGFGGNKRREATTFSIGNRVYMGTGVSNGQFQTDFWVFDLDTEQWSALLDLDDDEDNFIIRNNAVGFSIGDRGYFATGDNGFGASTSVWEYNPATDLWEEKTEYEGITRQGAIAFYNGTRAFLALGRSGNLYLDDNREFFPNEEEDEDD